MPTELAIIIPTTEARWRAFIWNLQHLLAHIADPFTVYVFNDHGDPLGIFAQACITTAGRLDVALVLLNDRGEIAAERVGSGGARHHLLQAAKEGGHRIILSLDDDMQITPGWYTELRAAIEAYPRYSVFSTVIRNYGENLALRSCGTQMVFDGIWLQRKRLPIVDGRYRLADWAPLGCLALCRDALHPLAQIPAGLFTQEDEALFLELHRLGCNTTVIALEAIIVHKPVEAPDVPGMRSYRRLQEAARCIWRTYGVNIVRNLAGYSYLGIPTDEMGMRRFVEEP